MKVKELLLMLEHFDQDMEIFVHDGEYGDDPLEPKHLALLDSSKLWSYPTNPKIDPPKQVLRIG